MWNEGSILPPSYYIFYYSFPFKEHFQNLYFKRLMLTHYSYEVPPTYYFLTVWQVKAAELGDRPQGKNNQPVSHT